ncbi:MAG TPA: M64 family metallopeptidase [Cyclobacteriaceae bacterium]|nr:M64 family metallopeptidase [Cyclobacteriaceae bacterium]HRJ82784.1 M64 family metallopeptidase [Cyclobacteriaceae bacterium]
MKRILPAILLILISATLSAQIFPVDTLFKNGKLQERINLVFLSDGYKADEMTKYIADVNGLLNNLFSQVPFVHYRNYFNAFAVKVPSNESGARHPQTSPDSDCLPVPQQAVVDNYFGSTFDSFNIHRLLVPTKAGAIGSVLAGSFPLYDQVFVLVNSPYYGGSGGPNATSSTHTSAHEVSIHEIGHSFAGLADEYWAGASYAAEKPNLTQQSNATLVKWANWVGTSGVGVYPHNEAPTWYRPHQNCKMRILNVPFCSVCNETFVERIHTLVNPLAAYTPTTLAMELGDQPIVLLLSLIKPEPNTMSITWKRNETTFDTNKESVSLSPSSFTTNVTKIKAIVTDNTALSRSATHSVNHVYVVEWTITTDNPSDPITSVEVRSAKSEYRIQVYPNPTNLDFSFSYLLPKSSKVSVTVSDLSGRKVRSLVSQRQEAGEHIYQYKANDVFKSVGEFIVTFSFDDIIISRKVIHQN